MSTEIKKIDKKTFMVNKKKVTLNIGLSGGVISCNYNDEFTGEEIIAFRKHLASLDMLKY